MSDDPWQQPYGGIGPSGGYRPNTEYELGAGRIAEEVHCILGSLGRVVRSSDKHKEMFPGIRLGASHISEEMALIMDNMEEYSKCIYTDQLLEREDNEYVLATLRGVPERSQKLRTRAKEMKENLTCDFEDGQMICGVAEAGYDTLIALADAMEESVEDISCDRSAFRDPKLQRAVERLEKTVEGAVE